MQAGVSAGSESEQETERGGQSPVFPCDWNLEWEVGRGETGGCRDFKGNSVTKHTSAGYTPMSIFTGNPRQQY